MSVTERELALIKWTAAAKTGDVPPAGLGPRGVVEILIGLGVTAEPDAQASSERWCAQATADAQAWLAEHG